MKSIKELVFYWKPGTDKAFVHDLNGCPVFADGFYTWGGCNAETINLSDRDLKMMVFIEAIHAIVRDKCDPLAVHRALLNVREYVDGCSYDMPCVSEMMDEL